MTLSNVALETSGPSGIVARARTPSVKGLILETEHGSPARTKISCAATAADGAPKTGPIR